MESQNNQYILVPNFWIDLLNMSKTNYFEGLVQNGKVVEVGLRVRVKHLQQMVKDFSYIPDE